MTSSFSDFKTAAAKQRGLKHKQSVMVFMNEGLLNKIGIARFLGESRKIVPRMNVTTLPRDEGKDLITIHHPTMDCMYAEISYTYVFSGPEDAPHSFGDMVTGDIYVWESQMLVPEHGETGAKNQKKPYLR